MNDIHPRITIVPDDLMREVERTSLNRLCSMTDWSAWGMLSNVMNTLRDSVCIHRKSWEYALCIHGLETLGAVHPRAEALAVGAGYERPLFYFANTIKKMVATDLYNDPDHEGVPDMLTHPERYAPFEFRRDGLEVLRMSGDDLRFDDNRFDFVFTLSSIEHFGSREIQRKSMSEMRRVIKSQGIACIATELILNRGTHREYFTYEEFEEMFLTVPGFKLVGGDLDLRIEESLVRYPVDLGRSININRSPHIVLRHNGLIWTSVMIFLQKV